MKQWILFLLILSSLLACNYDVEETLYPTSNCDSMDVRYVDDIAQIITNHCTVCHDAPGNPLGNGIVLTPYTEIKPYADSGILSCVINHEPGCPQMPKNSGKIPSCDIAKIENWIADGALNN